MSTPRNHVLIDIAMDISYMEDTIDYIAKIESKSPQLHGNIMPISFREMAYTWGCI